LCGAPPFPISTMSRQVPVRWIPFGECFTSTCCDCDTPAEDIIVNCNTEFNTISDMEMSTTTDWWEATCYNGNTGDNITTAWTRTDNPSMIVNGTDIRQTAGGIKVYRNFIREGSL